MDSFYQQIILKITKSGDLQDAEAPANLFQNPTVEDFPKKNNAVEE